MAINYRRAAASEAKPLIGLYAESGCGKTFSSLLLAKGFVGDMSRVAMIETESGRGEAWANDSVVGGYNVISIRENFSPKAYGEAISMAEKEGARGLIIDSASHEWEGLGGVLGMAAANQAAGKKGPLVWQQPKMDHAREFMLRVTQTPIPLVIVCMRAKYPMYEVTAVDVKKWEDAGRPGGRAPKIGDWARSWELAPKQSDDILFEMFIHGWIDRQHVFHGTKYTVDTLRSALVDGQPITVETGQRLAAWSSGQKAPAQQQVDPPAAAGEQPAYISVDQSVELETLCKDNGINVDALKAAANVQRIAMILAKDYDRAKSWVDRAIDKRRAA